MASNQYVGQTLVSPESLNNDGDVDDTTSGDWLALSQAEWGDVSAEGFYSWAAENGTELSIANYQEYYQTYQSMCTEDGHLDVEIQVRTSRADLNYVITASYGELTGPMVETSGITESLTVDGESSVDLQALAMGMVSARWEGAVYDIAGAQIVPAPEIEVEGSVLSFGQEVVGVLRLSYTEQYDTYILTIQPRESGDYDADDDSTAYQSTVIAVWSGGIESLDVDLPDMTGNCGGSNLVVDPDDDDDDYQCYDLYVTRNKCTNEVLKKELKRVKCPGSRSEDEEAELSQS